MSRFFLLTIFSLAIASPRNINSHPSTSKHHSSNEESFPAGGSTEKEAETAEVSDPTPSPNNDLFVSDLKQYVAAVPILSFEGDAILLQFVDPLNHKTTYRHLDPMDAIAEAVYETKRNDGGVDVIILTGDEDNIPAPKGDKNKRTYVVLRRAVQIDPHVYFVAYLYITEAGDSSAGIHNLGGRKVFLEWDFWDHREAIDMRAKSLENSFRCGNLIFIPCASNETMDYPLATQKPVQSDNGGRVLDLGFPAANPKVQERYHVVDGYDPDEFIDIYGDLDREIKLGRELTELPTDAAPPAPYLGRGRYFNQDRYSSNLIQEEVVYVGGEFNPETPNTVRNSVHVVKEMALGLVKNFEGLYGGLGTDDGLLAAIGVETGIEGTDDLEFGNALSTEEKLALVAAVTQSSAGGLGGLVTALEPDEATTDFMVDQVSDQVNPSVAKGRTLGAAWEPPGEEKPYVQFGWLKTNGATVSNDVFVGWGGCRYHHVLADEIHLAGGVPERIRLYQRALKTQCVTYEADFLEEIFKSGLLKVADDESFELREHSAHFTKEKLTVKQLKELLRGVQLAMFSKVYNAELRSPTPSTSAPDGSTISRSVFTLGQVVITGTGFSQENIWVDSRHGFKLNRNMIRTLKIAYQKLAEDKELLGEGDSGFEKELNYNNRVYVMALVQYLLRGSAPVYNSGVNPFKNFEEFYTKNKQVIEDRVNSRML